MLKFILVCLFLSVTAQAENANFQAQEDVLEHKIATATDSKTLAQATYSLAQIKIAQSEMEFKKMPEMVGRSRGIVNASVKENLSYRQIASSFKKDPGSSSIATSFKILNLMGLCCVLLGFFVMMSRLKYRY